MNSMPARSAIWHMAAMSSQLAAQRSGAKLMVRPPSQLALNTPSLNLFGPRIGLVVRVSLMGCSSRLSDRGVDAARRTWGTRQARCAGSNIALAISHHERAAIKDCFGSTRDHTPAVLVHRRPVRPGCAVELEEKMVRYARGSTWRRSRMRVRVYGLERSIRHRHADHSRSRA